MTTIQRPNKNAIIAACDIYRDAMRPFLLRGLRRVRGSNLTTTIRSTLPDHQKNTFTTTLAQNGNDVAGAIDIDMFPQLVQRHWQEIFLSDFNMDQSVRNVIWLIKDARDKASHPGTADLDVEYTRTSLFHIADVLGRINAPEQKSAVESIRETLRTDVVGVQAENMPEPTPSSSSKETRGGSSGRNDALAPWRSVIQPNQDVAGGTMRQSEFAANLQAVFAGSDDTGIYGNPVEFYRQTYITPGIRKLLVNTLQRLFGQSGDPVIQTKTGFGGGKTHSLIALYHLLTSPGVQVMDDVRDVIREAGLEQSDDLEACVAVLDCTHLSPTDRDTTDNGDPLNTLWGVLAWQLGGQEGYEMVGDAARQGISPGGGQLTELLTRFGPCVILIDELVAYVRNVLPEHQGRVYTFVQNLTQSVSHVPNAMLVVTLPEHESEAGGVAGEEALARLESVFGRIESVWEPLAVDETFAVVRRRLFGDIRDESERDKTCDAFARMYRQQTREYPPETREGRYLERLKECYPIHPEIFDRLYLDWSSIARFQRTRGVLRMLSICVNRLYAAENPSPLIMPGDLPLSDTELANEFIGLLDANWSSVLTEADTDNSRTDLIDIRTPRYKELGGAARRLARTIFLGSAPSGSVVGVNKERIHLGVVRPTQGISTYNEAMNQMSEDLYYLYSNDNRYYFHAEENLNKVVVDRSAELSPAEVNECIAKGLREAVGGGLKQSDVIVCPEDYTRIDDTDSTQLVVLPPDRFLPSRASDHDTATSDASDMLLSRGDGRPRIHRNALLFLTAKNDEIRTLRSDVRTYLAWDSIVNGARKIANLVGERDRQAKTSLRKADEKMNASIVGAYRWALAPVQDDPQQAEYRISRIQTEGSGEIIGDVFQKLVSEEILVEIISVSSLSNVLNRYIWNNDTYTDHIEIDTLWGLLTNNVYMPRLRQRGVLEECVSRGVQEGTFGYATAQDGDGYSNLCYKEPIQGFGGFGKLEGLLVNPDMAQLVKEMEPDLTADNAGGKAVFSGIQEDYVVSGSDDQPNANTHRGPQRIVVTKRMQGEISLDDARTLSDEIIRNLREDGGEISIEITVSAHKPDGFSESTTRAVRENSVQLGLELNI